MACYRVSFTFTLLCLLTEKETLHTVKKNTEAVLVASKDIGVAVNADNTE